MDVEYALGGGNEGAGGDEGHTRREEAEDRERREDHDPTGPLQQAHLARDVQALGAGAGVGGKQ